MVWLTDLVIALPVAVLVIWFLYDVAVAFWPGSTTPTITRRIQALSRSYPAIPYLAGLITGLLGSHFWGQF